MFPVTFAQRLALPCALLLVSFMCLTVQAHLRTVDDNHVLPVSLPVVLVGGESSAGWTFTSSRLGEDVLHAQFQDPQGKFVNFTLLLDDRTLSSQSQVVFQDKTFSARNFVQTQKTFLYVSDNKQEWASVVLDENDRVVSGVFSSTTRLGGDVHISADSRVRSLSSSEFDFTDLAIPTPGRSRKRRRHHRSKKQQQLLRAAGDNDNNVFFPGCFPGDASAMIVQISIATDAGFSERFGSDAGTVVREVERLVSTVRPLYLAQLNVQLQIKQIIVGTSKDTSAVLRRTPASSCPSDPLSFLRQFSDFTRTQQPAAHWHLLTNCYPRGVIGAGMVGGLCANSANNVAFSSLTSILWLTLAHEIGHVFGAEHTFYKGTGGIMDYGNGKLGGSSRVQFHPDNRDDICNELTSAVKSQCRHVQLGTNAGSAVCGNGVLEPLEECECTHGATVSCGTCVNCKMTTNAVKCNTAQDPFVLRHPLTPSFVSTLDTAVLVSHPDCCMKGQLPISTKRTMCNNGRDVCSPTGTCRKSCSTFLLNPCGFETDSGCIQKCIVSNVCQGSELKTMGPPPVPVGAVPDGLACTTQQRQGSCLKGVCQIPTTAPTKKASVEEEPNKEEDETEKPTQSPTPKPTPLPLTCPTARAFSTCPQQGRSGCTVARGCTWCVARGQCQVSPVACEIAANNSMGELEKLYRHCDFFSKSIEIAKDDEAT